MNAYMRYQDELSVRNSVAGGLGKGFRRRTGIPQGCPLSMQWMALILRPWLEMQIKAGNKPRVLADDILVMTTGEENMLHRFAAALDATHSYLIDMGAKIAPDKNSNFASTETARKWLKATYWKKLGTAITVVDNFRYLGAHMNVAGKNTADTLKKRIKQGIMLLHRVAKLPVTRAHKATLIRTKIFSAALYGSEVAQPNERDIATFAAATAKAIANKTAHHDIDWVFATFERAIFGYSHEPSCQEMFYDQKGNREETT